MYTTQLRIYLAWQRARDTLHRHGRITGDSGEVSALIVFTAISCAIAIAVGAIIMAKITQQAEDIPVR